MKLTPKTLQILKNFSAINPSIIFRPGDEISTVSPQKTIFAKAKIDGVIESEFAIYDLSRFLGVLSLFDDPDISLVSRGAVAELVISGNSGDKTKYVPADPSNIVAPPADKKIELQTVDVQFDLKEAVFNKVMKAMSIMSLGDFSFVGDGSTIIAKAGNTKNPTSDEYGITLGETNETFNVVFKSEYLRFIPGDYKVEISKKGLARFSNDTIEYFVPVEAKVSSFS